MKMGSSRNRERGMVLVCVLFCELVFPGSAAGHQNVISAAPEGVTLKGRLYYRVSGAEATVGDGHVFVLSADERKILAHSRTLGPSSGLNGAWEITGLPEVESAVVVAFSEGTRRLLWTGQVSLKGRRNVLVEDMYATMYGFQPGGPSGGMSLSSSRGPLPLLSLLGWVAGEVAKSLSSRQVDELTSRLLASLESEGRVRNATPAVSAGREQSLDLILCIDTTGSMADDIAEVKESASKIIDDLFTMIPTARIGMVSYRDYGSEYVTKGYPFSTDKEQARKDLLSLSIGQGGDDPEAVYEGLLHAIHTVDMGGWRDGVKKVIVLMGDAPPHNKRHSLDEVAKAAEEVDPAHVFPIAIAGSSRATIDAFSQIARRTGGVMSSTSTAAELPAVLLKMVGIGYQSAESSLIGGMLFAVEGDVLTLRFRDSPQVQPGRRVLVFSRSNTMMLIAEGQITSGTGSEYLAEVTGAYGIETPASGCRVEVLPD